MSHPNIVHWDDLESSHRRVGSIGSTWTNLDGPAGSKEVRLNRIRVDPGLRSTPLHAENAEEEIFFVLAGSGLSWQRSWESEATYEVRAGDCLVHLAGEEAHTLVAGAEGLEVLAFGVGPHTPLTYFPRISAMRVGPAIVDVDDRHQWTLEGALPEPELLEPSPRPRTIVNLDAVESEELERGRFGEVSRQLGGTAGSICAGLNHSEIPPDKLNCPVHCHSAEEEIFVVLGGDGVCILGGEEHPVRAGSIVARPPRTRVGHAFRGGPRGMTLLAYGTREPNDIAWYPHSKKIFFRGVGLMTRLPELEYWDGEA